MLLAVDVPTVKHWSPAAKAHLPQSLGDEMQTPTQRIPTSRDYSVEAARIAHVHNQHGAVTQ